MEGQNPLYIASLFLQIRYWFCSWIRNRLPILLGSSVAHSEHTSLRLSS